MRKAVVIGLDGGTFDILMPLIERGGLPNLKAMMGAGAWGRLRTVIPPGTGPAWSSIVTGLDPSNHGVFDLIVRAENSYNLAFLNASSLRAATLWDMVGGAGGRVLVLNVPMTFPPRQVNGCMVSGLLTPLGSRDCTYPREFLETILEIDPSYKIVPTSAYVPGKADVFLADIEDTVASKSKVLLDLLGRCDWDLTMQVFNETDFLQHAMWHVMDPSHPSHKPEDHARYSARIAAFYDRLDGLIGDMLRMLPDDASLIVISDHGHGPLNEFIHANNILLREGLMVAKRSASSRLKHLLFNAGFTPLNVYRAGGRLGLGRLRMGMRWTAKGYEMLRRLFFSFSDIDWERSEAYAISGGVFGGVFINLKGREPNGAVKPGRYEEVRDKVGRILSGLRHPRDGGILVKQVLRREDVYSGRFAEEAPDLFFAPRDETTAVFGDFEFSSNRVVEPASKAISAQHRMEGIFVAKGPGIKPGFEALGLHVTDVAPLVLYLMGLPIPELLDGNLPEKIFTSEAIAARRPSYCKLEDLPGRQEGGRRSMEDDSIKKRLKGLGYIS